MHDAQLEKALQIVKNGQQDPTTALRDVERHLRAVKKKAGLASLGISKIVPLDPATLTALTAVVGNKSSALMKWPGGTGYINSIFAGTQDGAIASLSKVGIRITINGGEEMITTGDGAAYARLVTLQPGNLNWVKLRNRRVDAQTTYSVEFINFAGDAVYVPWVHFGYIPEE